MDEVSGIYLLILAAFSAIFSGTFGFGAGLIFIPIGALFLPLKEVIALASVFYIFLNISKLFLYWKHVEWKIVLPFLLGSAPFIVLGSFMLLGIDDFLLEKLMGVMILLYIVFKKFGKEKKFKLNSAGITAGGALYGFLTGLTGMGNFVKAATLSSVGLKKMEFVATMGALPFVTTILRMIVYSKGGFYDSLSWQVVLGFGFCAIFGTYLGRHFLRKMTQNFFDNAILVILAVVALKFLFF